MIPAQHDKNGVPIHEGDLIRTPHYIGGRRKQHYLYHVAVEREGVLFMIPTSHLVPDLVKGGGACRLDIGIREYGSTAEVISGHGPAPYLSYEDRPKQKSLGAVQKMED
jgi:hypothetical protein